MKTIIRFMLLLLGIVSLSFGEPDIIESIEDTQEAKIDTFTFSSNGTTTKGKIPLLFL